MNCEEPRRRGSGRATDARAALRGPASAHTTRPETVTMGQTAGAECTPEDEDSEPRIRVNPTEKSLVSHTKGTFFFHTQNEPHSRIAKLLSRRSMLMRLLTLKLN